MELLARALSRHALASDTAALANQIGLLSGPGWCALRPDGALEIQLRTPHRLHVRLDGKLIRGTQLPVGWQRGRIIDVWIGETPLLGSPIDITAIRRTAGCVEAWDGGIRGWAWHPGDPETPPILTLRQFGRNFVKTIIPCDESIPVSGIGPLARPRWFHLTRAELKGLRGLVCIQGPDGADLPGSPLDPFADEAAHIATGRQLDVDCPAGAARLVQAAASICPATNIRARKPGSSRGRQQPLDPSGVLSTTILRADAPMPDQPWGADSHSRPTAIVIPVHDGGTVVTACLSSVLASASPRTSILVIDDGSSDPDLVAHLDDLARQRTITLVRHPRAQGFPASANAGMRAAQDHDIVLLNSDTLVPPEWIDRLRAAAYAAPDIGTVTPFSNDASILSYPETAGSNPCPDQAAVNRLDRFVRQANSVRSAGADAACGLHRPARQRPAEPDGCDRPSSHAAGEVVDIPVGVGFCLYLRRDCLNAVGSFRADLFAQGYGEENDFCLRARRLGWRSVALTSLFVGHVGGTSFGDAAVHLRARNGRIVEQCHPGHDALIERFIAADPLAQARRRIDRLIWRQRARDWRQAVILIAHNAGGGVEQRLILATKAHAQAGRRPVILRPAQTSGGEQAIAVHDGLTDDLPNLVYAVPHELPALLRLLRADRPEWVEAHHLADYAPAIYDLIKQLNLAYSVHVHDYAWFCPRISLVGGQDRYCGEPDLADCEACIGEHGHFLQEAITVGALRTRSAAFLSAARDVVVPSSDTGVRMRRHFPGLETTIRPHEDDQESFRDLAFSQARPARGKGAGRATVCLAGAIGVHKGFNVLLACARDAMKRDLDLEFIVAGHTIDDARVMDTGRVFVTGRFDPHEAVSLIAAQRAGLGFLPSICPETWCLSLGDLWRAGLRVAAFDIGAPAERIRQSGRGFLLPLGLSPGATNDALVAAVHSLTGTKSLIQQ